MLSPAAEQLQRCYAGLLADSLAREVAQGDAVLVIAAERLLEPLEDRKRLWGGTGSFRYRPTGV